VKGANSLGDHFTGERVHRHRIARLEVDDPPMLNIIQFTVESFARRFEGQGFDWRAPDDYNGVVNGLVEGTRDYLQAHYLASNRNDTAYWRDVRNNPNQSDSLREIMQAWQSDNSFDTMVGAKLDRHPYKRASWYCLFSGLGHYEAADKKALRSPEKNHRRCETAVKQAVEKYQEHGPWLEQLYGQSA
ncbi:MAG: tryptophan 7-halogenase, partial [Pseudomonadota bacterium]